MATGTNQVTSIQGAQAPDRRVGAFVAHYRPLVPGLLLAGVIAIAASYLEIAEGWAVGHKVIEALVIAILVGVIVRNSVRLPAGVHPGANYASKTILEFAVLVLGASIDVQTVFKAGGMLLVAITTGVVLGMLCSFLFGKAMGLQSRLAFLVAVGNSICGNSAIAAVAPVVKAERREVASAIGLTAVAGVIVIVILPVLHPALGLSYYQYGIVAGMGVYAVPQVVAAAFTVSQLSGEVATLVKLVRVMFLGPVVIATGLVMRLRGSGGYEIKRSQLLPWFVIGFFVLMAARSSGVIPESGVQPIRDFGRALTIWAMAGLGLGVELAAIKSVGPRVGITSVASMALLVSLSILLILVLGLNG